MATLQGREGTGMTRQDRTCQPSGAGEVKAGANENGYPICSPLLCDSDRQGEEEEGEDRGLSWHLGEGFQGKGRAAGQAAAPLACRAGLLA